MFFFIVVVIKLYNGLMESFAILDEILNFGFKQNNKIRIKINEAIILQTKENINSLKVQESKNVIVVFCKSNKKREAVMGKP